MSPDPSFLGPFPPSEMLGHMTKAWDESAQYLARQPDLRERLSALWFTCYHVLDHTHPSDMETLAKIGFVPFAEATHEMIYAVNFALMGVYKTAFERLRSFLELYLVGVYYVDPTVPKEDARKWVVGHAATPFMSKVRKALLARPNFLTADRAFSFSEDLATTYGELCDYVHTRGHPRTHVALGGNLPNFSASSLEAFVTAFARTAECVAVALALQFPVILQPVPMSAKFGFGGPISGFLEERQVRMLEGLIADGKLAVLQRISADAPQVQGIVRAIRELPDLTREELDKQLLEMAKLEIQGSGLEQWLMNQRAIMELVPDAEKEKILTRMEELTAWARERGFDRSPGD